jgi:hypothetical protein
MCAYRIALDSTAGDDGKRNGVRLALPGATAYPSMLWMSW